jgi:2-methylcitrate dehydratase PrpD
MPLHPHATVAAVGAAAGVARARGADEGTFLAALTGASTLITVGPFDHVVVGALIENAWAGVGAANGMRAVDFAACGISGLAASPYDVYVTGLGAEAHPEALIDGLGHDWAIAEGYNKIYSCCGYGHSAVEAVLPLIDALPGGKTAKNIDKVLVEAHAGALRLDNPTPETTLAGRFSIQQIVASACVHGHAGAEAFAFPTLRDPEIARLRDCIELRAFEPEMPWPNDRPARVTLTLDSGVSLTGGCLSAEGGPDRPFGPAVILDKAVGITAEVYPGFAGFAAALAERDEALMGCSWDDAVGEITAAG